MTAKGLATVRVGETAPTQEARKDERDETARQDGEGLGASQHAGAVQGGEPEKRQLQQQPKLKTQLQLKQQLEQQHKPKHKPTPTQARRWETVQPGTQSQRTPVGPGPAPTSRWSVAESRLILRRDEGIPLPNKLDQEIASAINRGLFHRKAPAHIWIMNAKTNVNGAITAITHQNTPAAMALTYRKDIINAAHTVNKGVINVEENESWERLKVHAVELVRYMGKGTESLQKMRDEMHAENKGVVIPIPV